MNIYEDGPALFFFFHTLLILLKSRFCCCSFKIYNNDIEFLMSYLCQFGLSDVRHHFFILLRINLAYTYGHSQLKTGHPVRSAIHKQLNGRLVLRWVTTWESLLLYVLFFCPVRPPFTSSICLSRHLGVCGSKGMILSSPHISPFDDYRSVSRVRCVSLQPHCFTLLGTWIIAGCMYETNTSKDGHNFLKTGYDLFGERKAATLLPCWNSQRILVSTNFASPFKAPSLKNPYS